MSDKLWIIIRREFLNIVTKKTFLIATFLLPIGFIGFLALEIAAISTVEKEDLTVLIPKENASIFAEDPYEFKNTSSLTFEIVDLSIDELKKRQDTAENEIFIKPPSQTQIADYAIGKVYVYSKNTVSEPTKSAIRKQMNKRIRAYRMSAEGLSEEKLKAIEFDLDLETKKVKEGEETQGIEILSKGIGIVMGFAIYMLLAIYGSILMQSVIEEKTNRIVEVIVSSVKPFQLLLGKIVALVGVAFTQLMIWGVAIFVIYLAAMPYLLSSVQGMEPAQVAEMDLTNAQDLAYQIQTEVELFDWSILWFLPLFFIGGFFIYGSLYAAVGSAVDNVQDAQQLVFPVMLPLILSILVGMNVIQNPNSTLAVVCSYIPFFSPMIMPVRMAATDVAWWEIILSLLSLGAGFLGCVWLAAKVYRTGILMYGKKASFKELWRWIKA